MYVLEGEQMMKCTVIRPVRCMSVTEANWKKQPSLLTRDEGSLNLVFH